MVVPLVFRWTVSAKKVTSLTVIVRVVESLPPVLLAVMV